MNIVRTEIFQGEKIEILEMFLENTDKKLELSLKIYFQNEIFKIKFFNVSSLTLRELSVPLEVHGFEIINHSKSGWEKDSKYEIRDFEDDRVNFFCENYKVET